MNNSNKRKVIITLIAILVLVLTIGGAYALWTYTNTLGNQTLIAGDIYMKFTEGDTLNMKEAMPSLTYNPDEYFEFSVEGKNKYSKDVIYEILLDEGEVPTGEGNESRTERIKAKLLKFRLVEIKDGKEEELIQEGSYDSIQRKRIWVDKVPAKTTEEIKYTYRLYMWISKDTKIGDAETDDYTAEVWNNNVFASVKVAVNGDFNPKDLTEDYLILNAQDTSGEKYDLKQPTGATKDIIVTLGSKREVTKFVVSKSDQYPIALMSLPDETDYPASYNETTRAWEAKVTIEETGIYDYYAVYDEEGTNSKTYSFTVMMSPDRYVKVEKPTSALCKAGLTYTGNAQDLIAEENLDQTGYTIEQKQGTDADKYQVTAKLKKEYAWSDSTRTDATFECEIAKKETVLTYEPASEFKVNKGASKTLKITATTSGTFDIETESSQTASAMTMPLVGTSTTVTVQGNEIGTTKLIVNFKPDNENYTEKDDDSYEIEVAKAAGATKLKESLGQTGGIIGIKSDNTKTTSPDDEVREYRYMGATANNYVTFNDEKWRIIGIFKDESGTEHMKIIRNNFLTTEMPATYQADGKTFQINSGNYGRWDYDGSNYNNNWADAGLMYWLNSKGTDSNDTGYLNKIKAPYNDMIEETKWYLGTVVYSSGNGIQDTTKEAYAHERDIESCVNNKGSSATTSGCRVWANNAAYWTGKIGLMYPSDMGFSTSDSYWNTQLYSFGSTQLNTTWLKEGHTTSEWFLSPSSFSTYHVAGWNSGGVVDNHNAHDGFGVRPVLYLKSDISIKDGEGTSTTPYTLTS